MEMNGSSQSNPSSACTPSACASQPPPLKPAPAATTPQQVAAAAAALAATRAASVSAAMRSVFGAKQQAALASAMMNASVNAAASKGVAARAMAATPTTTTKPTTPRATTSVVVMPNSFDGLPLLPSHAASLCDSDDSICVSHAVPRDGAIAVFGEPTTRADVRAMLVHHYATTKQLDDANAISEMTLRVDTELEMLRRQCFAERNARWQFFTPDVFAPAPVHEPVWVAASYVGPRRQTLLRRKHHERLPTTDKPSDHDHHDELVRALVGPELVRERAWPPKEFVAKSGTKPSRVGGAYASHHTANRTSSGKKKPVGMVGVVDETPLTSRTCAECATQRSALWRTRPRVNTTEEEDVCLPCYIKTQRRDLFERKATEKAKAKKEEAARAAAEARALKKQQQQMQKKIKKLQQLQQQQESETVDNDAIETAIADSVDEPFAVKKEDDSLHIRLKLTRRDSLTTSVSLAPPVTTSYDETVDVASHDDKKKRDKKSKKDKKKKKKKKKKKASENDWDDSDSDDDGAASSVVLPSPPQRPMDGFVYADRADILSTQGTHNDDADEVAESSTKRTSHKRAAASKTPSSSSKKRKSLDAVVDVSAVPVSTPTPSSRGSRARSTPTPAAAPPPTPTPTARKRAKATKKETARERELRALGQYCPVCNMTYEEDDASPFVCCDSCEMWVHAACDSSLTPAMLATLGDSNEKYICPLCGGR